MFVAACALALPFYAWAGSEQWFFQDEWVLLANRPSSLGDLLAPHNEHMILPARLIYAGLWPLFGLRHHLPYQLPVILAHIGLATALRAVMRRAGVSEWLATVVAVAFLGFGAGSANIVWAFQITFTGALLFGYAHLLLADHPGPVGRRDALALAAGALAVASSVPGLLMVWVVGVAMLVRRGWKVAALHSVPLTVAFLAWSAVATDSTERSSPGQVVRFAVAGLTEAARKVAPGWPGLIVLAALVLAGVVLLARRESPKALVRLVALPLALAGGAVALMLLSGVGRAHTQGIAFAAQSRYSHAVLALGLPMVAVALQAVADSHRAWGALGVVVLLAQVPVNLGRVEVRAHSTYTPTFILATAMSPKLDRVPGAHAPFDATGMGDVTVDWMVRARRDGQVPRVDTPADVEAAIADMLVVTDSPAAAGEASCRPLTGEKRLALDAGQGITLNGSVLAWTSVAGRVPPTRGYGGDAPYRLTANADRVELVLAPFETGSAEIC